MHVFHVISFILATVIYTMLTLYFFFALFDRNSWRLKKENISERVQLIIEIISRCIAVALIYILLIYSTIPHWKDMILLAQSHYSYIEGKVSDIYNRERDLNDYVVIHGKSIGFSFTSKMKVGKEYLVLYLPHTNAGIDAIQSPR